MWRARRRHLPATAGGSARLFWFRRPDIENESLIARIEWAADLGRNFHLLLNPAARDQGRVQARKDFVQRQWDSDAVAVDIRRKDVGGELTQFAESDFDRAPGKLRKNFFEGDRDAQIADITFHDSRLNFERQAIEDRLQRNLDGAALALRGRLALSAKICGGLSAGALRLRNRGARPAILASSAGASARLRSRGNFGLGSVVIVGLFGCWSRVWLLSRRVCRLPD